MTSLGHLGLGAGPFVDGGLRGAAAGGHGLKKTAAHVGQAQGQKLLVGIGLGLTMFLKGPRRGDGLGKRHQRDAHCTGQQRPYQGEIGQGEGWKTSRDIAGQLDALGLQVEYRRYGDAKDHGHQRCRQARHQARQENQDGQRKQPQDQGRPVKVPQPQHQGRDGLIDGSLGHRDAQDFADLADKDHHADAGFEAGQHRGRDEIGDHAQPEHKSQHQQGAHHDRQGGRSDEQFFTAAPGRDRGQRGGGQHPDGRRHAVAERARGTHQGIDQHRGQGRIQADLGRQPGNAGVGHGLGNDDRGGRQAGDQVQAQPGGLVVGQPAQDGDIFGDSGWCGCNSCCGHVLSLPDCQTAVAAWFEKSDPRARSVSIGYVRTHVPCAAACGCAGHLFPHLLYQLKVIESPRS